MKLPLFLVANRASAHAQQRVYTIDILYIYITLWFIPLSRCSDRMQNGRVKFEASENQLHAERNDRTPESSKRWPRIID